MGKKGPLWWRESDWLLRGSSAANQILLRHSGPILSVKITDGSNISTWSYCKWVDCLKIELLWKIFISC